MYNIASQNIIDIHILICEREYPIILWAGLGRFVWDFLIIPIFCILLMRYFFEVDLFMHVVDTNCNVPLKRAGMHAILVTPYKRNEVEHNVEW